MKKQKRRFEDGRITMAVVSPSTGECWAIAILAAVIVLSIAVAVYVDISRPCEQIPQIPQIEEVIE